MSTDHNRPCPTCGHPPSEHFDSEVISELVNALQTAILTWAGLAANHDANREQIAELREALTRALAAVKRLQPSGCVVEQRCEGLR